MVQRNRAIIRSCTGIIAVCWLAVLSVTPASADSHHATFTFNALPAALTLSDAGNPRFGLIEAVLTGQLAKRARLTVTVKATEVIQFVRTNPDVVCTTSSAPDRQHANLVITTFTCSADRQHPASSETIPIEFRSPSSAQTCSGASSSCLTFNATVTSNRGDARDDDAWDDDESDHDEDEAPHASSTVRLFAPGNKAAADGNCVTSQTTLGTLANQNSKQATEMTFGVAAEQLPCTPGTAGVDPQHAPTPLHTNISFVEMPKLNQPARVQVSFSTLPPGGSAHAFVLFELVGYKFGRSVSQVSSTIVVPMCQYGAIPGGHDACVLTKAPLGDGDGDDANADDGVVVTLLVNPTSDPGFAG